MREAMTSDTASHAHAAEASGAPAGDGGPPSRESDPQGAAGGKLTWDQRRFFTLLGLPSFGVTLAVTTVSTYVPVFIQSASDALVTGVLIGAEGFFGLFLPALIGTWSDRVGENVQARMRFLLVAAPLGAGALFALGVVHSLVAIVLALAVFYVAYFTFLAPYWALYPDMVPPEMSGRSRGFESTWRELGTGLALIVGGVLLAAYRPLPFLLAGAVLVGVTLVLFFGLRRRPLRQQPHDAATGAEGGSVRATVRALRTLMACHGDIRALVIANACWNATLAAIKAFVVLYFTVGLGKSASLLSAIFAVVAIALVIAAPVSGKLADRFGPVRVLHYALWVYGLGLLVPFFSHATAVIVIVPIVGFAAATVMTLPFAALMRIMPAHQHGAASGLFGFSRGAGTLAGPIVAGVAIQLTHGALPGTHGYGVMWLVAGAFVLASLPLLTRIERVGPVRS
jgi:MFS family permease